MEICSLVLYHDPVGSCMQVITLRQLLLSPCVHLVTLSILILSCHGSKNTLHSFNRPSPHEAIISFILVLEGYMYLYKDTRNCPEKAMKISHFNPNQSAPSIYIKIDLCYFSLDQWKIRIHLLWGKSFNIPLHCDPHLNQTKFNDLLPLTIPGVLNEIIQCFKR